MNIKTPVRLDGNILFDANGAQVTVFSRWTTKSDMEQIVRSLNLLHTPVPQNTKGLAIEYYRTMLQDALPE